MQEQIKKIEDGEIIFLNSGDEPTLMEVLDRREERVFEIQRGIKNYNCPAICFKLNIPGPVKNNDFIYKIFLDGVKKIDEMISKKEFEIVSREEKNLKTGPELLLFVDRVSARELKKAMLEIEERDDIGRLYDIDVEDISGSVKREEVGEKKRKCFICDEDAKVCASSRKHSVHEMLVEIEKIVKMNKLI